MSTNAGDSPPLKPEIMSYVAKICRRYKYVIQEIKVIGEGREGGGE